ncbi:MAG: indolepyruvate ferredoxin oxidoreductase subunit alpha [Peptococcaceae bacterium]|nr:indolepyruvate ferredoxin oxidoreductase subunit alpha [Peptococcaceae bacterium]
MPKQLVMGNEAVALGAIMAGVNLVSGYPGTPSTEILETVARKNPGDIYVEWSVNEKVAMEVAAGASYAGGRVMVTMKQVGLNVASDPLMSLTYVGTNGGMVIAVADDPGPISSQTEQDTRHYGKFANLPVFDPSTPEEAYHMVQEGFRLSEEVKIPVILRLSTRICHACATLEYPENLQQARQKHIPSGFVKDPNWVIFPSLAYRKHLYLEEVQTKLAQAFDRSGFNSISGSGYSGVATGGNTYNMVVEAVEDLKLDIRILKIGTPYPFPEETAVKFVSPLDRILVIEELDGVIEEALLQTCSQFPYRPVILGKKSGHLPLAGEFTYEIVKNALSEFMKIDSIQASHKESGKQERMAQPKLPMRPPVLCAGCPHRAAFYAVKKALKGKEAVFTGDIGCYTLGNAKPLDMVDTCLCMGAGITIAQGLYRLQPEKKNIAFIGDSTFFHTGLPGIVNAVYNNADITVIVLDNSTTAMTGHQPHPGTGATMMQNTSGKVDIEGVLKACGLKVVDVADPLDLRASVEKVQHAVDYKGPSAVLFRSPCIALVKRHPVMEINQHDCTGCYRCIKEIGCPAISPANEKVLIDDTLCMGCGLCSQICACQAIKGKEQKGKGEVSNAV